MLLLLRKFLLLILKNARDEIYAAIESSEAGWIKVNMQPIKKTVETYASKWVFTFTKYLSDQVGLSFYFSILFNLYIIYLTH